MSSIVIHGTWGDSSEIGDNLFGPRCSKQMRKQSPPPANLLISAKNDACMRQMLHEYVVNFCDGDFSFIDEFDQLCDNTIIVFKLLKKFKMEESAKKLLVNIYERFKLHKKDDLLKLNNFSSFLKAMRGCIDVFIR